MDNLIETPSGANRALFLFEGLTNLTATVIPTGQLTLSGPSETLDAAHWPVRGDLAHLRLAGKVFVPHYAVPMEHRVISQGAILRSAGHSDAEALDTLLGGSLFNVLDMSGGWAWGQVGEDGYVGYLPLDTLEA